MRMRALPSRHLSGALLALAMLCAAPAKAQQDQGAIILSRDVPAGYAFLPHAGEAHTVQTAPFIDVWGNVSPGKPLSDSDAAQITSDMAPGELAGPQAGDFQLRSTAGFDATRSDLGASPVSASGVGALVSGAVGSGMQSLQSGLEHLRIPLGQGQ